MSRRFIQQLGDRENVDEVYLASEKQLRTNRNGQLYLQVRLSDRTGSMTGMMWNVKEQAYDRFENGDYLRVQGAAQCYNGAMQMILKQVDRIAVESIEPADFVTMSDNEVDRLAARLAEILRQLSNEPLRNLAECFLMDEALMKQLRRAPAGVKNHHAYHGGLLEHIVHLLEAALAMTPLYPQVNPELVLLGVFLHDLGKVRELTYQRELGYSDEGQMIGHLVIGVEILNEKIRKTEELTGEPFPATLKLHLQHLILSHHGEYEFGSPKLPMTLEAVMLHQLDDLDAKIHHIDQLIQNDASPSGSWTSYHASLRRKFYKGGV